MSKEIGEEYSSSLADLTMNSKPLINMLTILAEENLVHASIIVQAVETHLEKVRPEIKLPVLYLVDSIIKNVGGAYTQLFSQTIVNMFCRTFKQVDEKTRSQMFKLRETWHEVFPANRLYQLDVKVNLIDPAWPIQAQPPQANIHVNPNFFKKSITQAATSTSSTVPVVSVPAGPTAEEKMMSALKQKKQELLLLKKRKIQMELAQTQKQLVDIENEIVPAVPGAPVVSPAPFVAPTAAMTPVTEPSESGTHVPARQRLGPVPPRNPSAPRIAPVAMEMVSAARPRDPRLARRNLANAPLTNTPTPPKPTAPPTQHTPHTQQPPIASNVFDIKPLDKTERHTTKSKNAITIDVRPDLFRPDKRRDPRMNRNKAFADDMLRNNDAHKEPKQIRGKETLCPPITADTKKVKLPPIPKLSKSRTRSNNESLPNKSDEELSASPSKRKKESSSVREKRSRKNRESPISKRSPEKSSKNSNGEDLKRQKPKQDPPKPVATSDAEDSTVTPVTFKELKTPSKDRNYMRRNREQSESPDKETETTAKEPTQASTPVTELVNNSLPHKDVDLRILPAVPEVPPVPASRKRFSSEGSDKPATKKSKAEKFDVLFGNEDVDLRPHLTPVVDAAPALAPERVVTPPPPTMTPDNEGSPDSQLKDTLEVSWAKVKDKTPIDKDISVSPKTQMSQLDVVRAKLDQAMKGKDPLGRPLLYNKLPDDPEERKRSMSMNSEDIDMRFQSNNADVPMEEDNLDNNIQIIMSQATEKLKVGEINKEQYNVLMMQVLQLNEKQKLKEAKLRESLEASKRKLNQIKNLENNKYSKSPLQSNSEDEADGEYNPNSPGYGSPPHKSTAFGDIDDRIVPHAINNNLPPNVPARGPPVALLDISIEPNFRVPPINPDMGPVPPQMNFPSDSGFPMRGPRPLITGGPPGPQGLWRGPRGTNMRPRGPMPPPFWRNQFPNRPPFDPRMPMPPFPQMPPMLGVQHSPYPFPPYERLAGSPPPLGGAPSEHLPRANRKLIDYIDQDTMKTIDIDGVPREIRLYGDTAIVMLDWDEPREIKFLPGTRRLTFDDKDSFILAFNQDYTVINLEDQQLRVKYGTPTRELVINDRWYECFFGGPPVGIVVDGKVRMLQLEGPPPQVDIGKTKRTDLVAGKINLIVDAVTMLPVFLDAKPQKFETAGSVFTLRFVDSLRTVLINGKPFKVEFGGLPKSISIGRRKHFIRFSALPKNIKPGQIDIRDMDGLKPQPVISQPPPFSSLPPLVTTDIHVPPPTLNLNQDSENSNPGGGLDMLASLMPSSMAPASQFSGYSLAASLEPNSNTIPGLETPSVPAENTGLSFLQNINVNDLFAKLVATGIVNTKAEVAKDEKTGENKPPEKPENTEEKTAKKKVLYVDLMRPPTMKVKQPGLVEVLYSGMQCSGCGVRFPPEHTVRYSQHLDWHFRQNRRERDSARRAHSRKWHYDISDWIQYEEIEDLEEREKSWFETSGVPGAVAGANPESPSAAPVPDPMAEEALSVRAGAAPNDRFCALCGDKFDQFYNEDLEEWHLRRAVRNEDNNYHPTCFEEYKESLLEKAKMETTTIDLDETQEEPLHRTEPAEEPKDDMGVDSDEDDNDSVVVVLSESACDNTQDSLMEEPAAEPDKAIQDLVAEEEEEDEDDVVLKEESVEEIVVDDDADTDDETEQTRAERDRVAKEEFDFSKVKIKQEPTDPDDEPIITIDEEDPERPRTETTHTDVTSSIDGNVQMESAPQVVVPGIAGGIRINISKPISAPTTCETLQDTPEETTVNPESEVAAEEEPVIEYKLKPGLEDCQFEQQPVSQKGTELSGLCSIM